MNAIPVDNRPPDIAVRDLIDRHGLRPILIAVLGLALHRGHDPAPRRAEALSDHLRRDIGLPPATERRQYWELK